MATSSKGNLDWLLQELVAKLSGARHAVVLSNDGLLMGRSNSLPRDDAEQFSAVASAFQSLARSTGRQFDGGQVRQTVVEMDRACLFVTAAGNGACLALLAESNANFGMIAFEMTQTVKRVGTWLSAAPRNGEVEQQVHPQTS